MLDVFHFWFNEATKLLVLLFTLASLYTRRANIHPLFSLRSKLQAGQSEMPFPLKYCSYDQTEQTSSTTSEPWRPPGLRRSHKLGQKPDTLKLFSHPIRTSWTSGHWQAKGGVQGTCYQQPIKFEINARISNQYRSRRSAKSTDQFNNHISSLPIDKTGIHAINNCYSSHYLGFIFLGLGWTRVRGS